MATTRKPPPLTDLERQKAFNIRKTHPDIDTLAREMMKRKEWDKLNTRGNPKK